MNGLVAARTVAEPAPQGAVPRTVPVPRVDLSVRSRAAARATARARALARRRRRLTSVAAGALGLLLAGFVGSSVALLALDDHSAHAVSTAPVADTPWGRLVVVSATAVPGGSTSSVVEVVARLVAADGARVTVSPGDVMLRLDDGTRVVASGATASVSSASSVTHTFAFEAGAVVALREGAAQLVVAGPNGSSRTVPLRYAITTEPVAQAPSNG